MDNLTEPCGHEPSQSASQLHGVCIFCWRDRASAIKSQLAAANERADRAEAAFADAVQAADAERVKAEGACAAMRGAINRCVEPMQVLAMHAPISLRSEVKLIADTLGPAVATDAGRVLIDRLAARDAELSSLRGRVGVLDQLKCQCGREPSCFGAYEGEPVSLACNTCCAHGNENGWCKPLPDRALSAPSPERNGGGIYKDG